MEKKYVKNYNKWYFLVPFVLFFLVAYCAVNQSATAIDKTIYTYISQHINPTTTVLFQIITITGTLGMMLFITIIIYFKNKDIAKQLLVYMIVISLIKEVLKYLFMRPRPTMMWLIEATGYSFPSGHSTLSLCFYGLCIYFLMKSTLPYKRILSMSLIILIFCIGVSRIYLGVHYFSDVLAGFLLGLSYLIYVINNFRLKT